MRRVIGRELMDEPDVPIDDLRKSFDDIELANRYFGGIASVRDAVFASGARSLLDVGCGSADIPRALLRAARARRIDLEVVALDTSEAALRVARDRAGIETPMRFVRADGGALPFARGAFDVATCNLALHHFEPDGAVALLRELRRVAAKTPIVCDLRRSRLGLIATSLFARVLAKSRLSKHDAPLSMRRAYTPPEAVELARRAGWARPAVKNTPFFRMVLTDRG